MRSLTGQPPDLIEQLESAAAELEGRTPQQAIAWAVAEYSPHLALACSFGGVSGMALLDMAVHIDPGIEVFYLDTGVLFPETYATIERAIERYGIRPVGYRSLLSLEEQAARHGEALWSRDPDLCCELRKVEPNRRALQGKRAWLSGLRRDQGATRRDTPVVEWDAKFGLVKVNPLASWTERQVWAYIVENHVPYNPLHDRGYPSIGCVPCTRPVAAGKDPRSGRWQGFEKTECGLHVQDSEGA